MKTILVLLLTAGLTSATSMYRYDKWLCTFPNTQANAMIKSTNVRVNYDFLTKTGKAVLAAECTNCHIHPREISIERQDVNNAVVYKNSAENIYLQIFWNAINTKTAPYTAQLGKVPGKCVVLPQ